MRLADFIKLNMEAILSEWEVFARTLLPASFGMDMSALRDHAEQILLAAAKDMATDQSEDEQAAKSRGEVSCSCGDPETAAQTHGLLRATDGFTLKQLVAEYRALRATVLRLWADKYEPGTGALEDMTRFNEAIDQAVAESVDFFAAETERWRHLFLGVLGHDLRGPLNAILLTSQVLSQFKDGSPISQLAGRLLNGGERMKQLLDDLLDYSRVSMDLGIHVRPVPVELSEVCKEEIELQRAAWPANAIELVADGETHGMWDAYRLKQVLGNLIGNAAKYGDRSTPIVVRLEENDDEVVLSVENSGPTIAASEMSSLFEPMQRAAHGNEETERTSLGLGLFIVSQIVRAHEGTVSLSSEDGKTAFRVSLPRKEPPAA